MDKIAVILLMILAFAGGWLVSGSFKKEKPCITSAGKIYVHDTITALKPSEPLIIEKYHPVIRVKRDTLVISKPFMARIDTIIKRDTIIGSYEFPENFFSMRISSVPDSILTREIVIEKPCGSDNWWETPAIAAGGLIIGALLGRAMK